MATDSHVKGECGLIISIVMAQLRNVNNHLFIVCGNVHGNELHY